MNEDKNDDDDRYHIISIIIFLEILKLQESLKNTGSQFI